MNKKIRGLSFVFPLFLLSSCVIPYKQTPREISGDINIYYINDTHGAFNRQNTESNYYETGVSYLGAYLKSEKNKSPESTIILSGGDMFQGGYESNITHGEIIVDAMNYIGFDGMVLGNHEFDWGEDALRNICEKLDCPVLSANTFYSANYTAPDYISPYTIIEKHGIKVGVIGASKYNMGTSITGSIASQFDFPNPISYVKRYSDKLRTEENCDLVIAAFHDGDVDQYYELTLDSITTGKKYIDGLFLAHDHRQKEGVLNGVPYLESACNGRVIGKMTFSFNEAKEITSFDKTTSYAYEMCSTSDPYIDSLINKYKDAIGDPSEVICTLSRDYSKEEFTVVIAQSMMWYVNGHKNEFGNETVYFSSHNVGGVRVPVVPRGELTLSEIFTICPFDNALCIQKCTSSNIDYMERSNYYRTYKQNDIVYDNSGLTTAVSIAYISEDETYGPMCQQSYIKYEGMTAKLTLIAYLRSGIQL